MSQPLNWPASPVGVQGKSSFFWGFLVYFAQQRARASQTAGKHEISSCCHRRATTNSLWNYLHRDRELHFILKLAVHRYLAKFFQRSVQRQGMAIDNNTGLRLDGFNDVEGAH